MKALCLAVCASGLIVAAPAAAHEVKPASTATAQQPKPAPDAISANSDQGKSKVAQHSGGTDANGCHTNHATGEYHCHNPK